MTSIVLGQAVPRPPRPPVNPGWDRARVLWRGWDGSEWDLTDPRGGVFLVRGGMRGLGMPKIEHYRDRSPAVHGAFYRGTSYAPREVFWPVFLYHDGSTREWVERDRAWWDSLHPEHEGVLTVEVPGVSSRSIRVRLEDDDDWVPEVDPAFMGWASYGVRLQADQPLWEGQAAPGNEWTADDPVPFHGGKTPGAPVIRISSGRTMAAATLTNPGDVEAWPIWTFNGPTGEAGATATIAGRTVSVALELALGEKVVIDTRPTEQTAFKYSATGSITDVFEYVNEIDFAPVPARSTVDLVLTTSGSGRISVDLTPLYLRAW